MKIYDVTASRFSLKHKAIISFKVQHKNENTTVLGYINICFRFLLIRPNTSNFSKHNLVRSVVLLRPAWLRVLVTLLEIQGVGTAGFLWNCGYKVVSPPIGRVGIGRGAPLLMANRLPPVLGERTR